MHKGKNAVRKTVLAALIAMMMLAGGLQIAEADMTQLLGAFVSEKLLHGLPFGLKTLSLACSSYAAQTPEGDYIQGRNMDFALAQNILVRTNPKDGYASLSMASGELLGYLDSVPEDTIGQLFILAAPYYALDGINEKGLSIAILLQSEAEQAYQDTGKLLITTTLAIRLVLDKAATVAEAIDLLAQYDMHSMLETNFHYLIADAEGDRAVIEYVDHGLRVIRSEGYGLGVTNFFLSPDVVEAVRDGEDRLEIIQAALDAGEGIVDYETAWQILGDVKAVHDLDEVRGIDYNTAYSMIFNNTKRTMDVCINMHFDRVYTYDVIEAN